MQNSANHEFKTDNTPPRKYIFETLAPVDNIEMGIYNDAINFAFDDPTVKNVAISGAYGSGKSSILATYEKHHPERRFIHISLAHFKPESKEIEETQKKEILTKDDNGQSDQSVADADSHSSTTETMLEGKILNQLIHQLKEKDIPQTNFRIKKTLSKKQVVLYSIAIIALFVSVIHLALSYTWINFVSTFSEDCWLRGILELTTAPLSFWISGCVGFVILSWFVASSVKKQRFRAAIRKMSIQGNDIELFEKETDSFFDKYLNEVLYLFENANVDAIVFEDMDRYDMEGIFERLHEVNIVYGKLEIQ